jgi:hypothetical protein
MTIDYSTFSEVTGITAPWLDSQWDLIYPIATVEITSRGTWTDANLKSAAELASLSCYVKRRESARLQSAGQAVQSAEVKDEYKHTFFNLAESTTGQYDPCSEVTRLINLDRNSGVEFQGGFETGVMTRDADDIMQRCKPYAPYSDACLCESQRVTGLVETETGLIEQV